MNNIDGIPDWALDIIVTALEFEARHPVLFQMGNGGQFIAADCMGNLRTGIPEAELVKLDAITAERAQVQP